MAKLSIADSYYLQGGSKSLVSGSRISATGFSSSRTTSFTCDTMMKIAEIHLKQVIAADRDPTSTQARQRQLKEMLRSCRTPIEAESRTADEQGPGDPGDARAEGGAVLFCLRGSASRADAYRRF